VTQCDAFLSPLPYGRVMMCVRARDLGRQPLIEPFGAVAVVYGREFGTLNAPAGYGVDLCSI
jgi:hypothetical protein